MLFRSEGRESTPCLGAGGQCDAEVTNIRTSILQGNSNHWLRADPLGEFMQSSISSTEAGRKSEICGVCAQTLRERERQMRQELWDGLPGMLAGVEQDMKLATGAEDDEDRD